MCVYVCMFTAMPFLSGRTNEFPISYATLTSNLYIFYKLLVKHTQTHTRGEVLIHRKAHTYNEAFR